MAGDDFEAAEMRDGAPIVRRDKVVSRGLTGIFLATGCLPILIAVLVAVMNPTADKPLSPTALPIVLALLAAQSVAMWLAGIAFGVLRTVITRKAVHVKYGLWGPTIPLEAIESVRVVEYDWTEFGGWGIRHGRKGARAYVPRGGPCVELIYDDGEGSKRVLIGAENASATSTAINQARSRSRIADDAAAEVEREVEAEETEEAARQARR